MQRMRREMLSDLAKLGFHFRALEAFVESTCGADAFLQSGLYRHALASGLTGMQPAATGSHGISLSRDLSCLLAFFLFDINCPFEDGSCRHSSC